MTYFLMFKEYRSLNISTYMVRKLGLLSPFAPLAQRVESGRHDGGHVDVIMALTHFAPPTLHTNAAILLQHSRRKSALIFCSTSKGAEEAAQCLSKTAESLRY